MKYILDRALLRSGRTEPGPDISGGGAGPGRALKIKEQSRPGPGRPWDLRSCGRRLYVYTCIEHMAHTHSH